MSDSSDNSSDEPQSTQKLERPDFDAFEDDLDGTQEVDASEIELLEESAIEPVEPPDATLERPASDPGAGESTQVIERDRLQQAAKQDEQEGRDPDTRSTEKMSAIDDTTSVVMDSPDAVEDTTTAYRVPEELLEQAAGGSKTQQMSAVNDETAEFDGSIEQWIEVDESGVVRCIAHVDEEGRLVIPDRLLEDGLVRPGMKIVIEAQVVRTDE